MFLLQSVLRGLIAEETGSAESSGSTIKIFLRYSDGATADATLTANENWDSANGKAADGCILIAKRTN